MTASEVQDDPSMTTNIYGMKLATGSTDQLSEDMVVCQQLAQLLSCLSPQPVVGQVERLQP